MEESHKKDLTSFQARNVSNIDNEFFEFYFTCFFLIISHKCKICELTLSGEWKIAGKIFNVTRQFTRQSQQTTIQHACVSSVFDLFFGFRLLTWEQRAVSEVFC